MIDEIDLFAGYCTACSFRGFLPSLSSICAPPASLIFFVNLRNGISTSCKQEMLLQCLRLFSSYTQKIKAPLCDWKGHVVNLPI